MHRVEPITEATSCNGSCPAVPVCPGKMLRFRHSLRPRAWQIGQRDGGPAMKSGNWPTRLAMDMASAVPCHETLVAPAEIPLEVAGALIDQEKEQGCNSKGDENSQREAVGPPLCPWNRQYRNSQDYPADQDSAEDRREVRGRPPEATTATSADTAEAQSRDELRRNGEEPCDGQRPQEMEPVPPVL